MREAFQIDDRRAMTPARKRRIHAAWDGKCWFCRMPVDLEGPGVVYDHVGTLWITGSDADSGIGPIHAATCNKIKTKADKGTIAHIKRLIAKNDPDQPRKPSRLKSRGFSKTLSRKFSGQVVTRG